MSLLKDPIFSPFSPHLMTEEHHRSLLLQFLLHEFFSIHSALKTEDSAQCLSHRTVRYLPYDWVMDSGPLNRAHEYASLLTYTFPLREKIALNILKGFNKLSTTLHKKLPVKDQLKNLYLLIEKLFVECEDNENLLFFLLKQQASIDALMGTSYLRSYFLKKYPKGLRSLEEMVCDHYHERGFFSLIPELKELITALEND